MIKSWTDDAWEEFEYWLEQEKKTIRQIKKDNPPTRLGRLSFVVTINNEIIRMGNTIAIRSTEV